MAFKALIRKLKDGDWMWTWENTDDPTIDLEGSTAAKSLEEAMDTVRDKAKEQIKLRSVEITFS